MADAVETPEVVNVEETPKEKEVTVEEAAVTTEKSTTEPEESSNGEQNGSEKNGDVKENGTAKEENGTAAESGDERKRKSIDVGDSTEVADVTPDKKAKLDEKIEGKQDEVVDSPAEQIAA